MIHNGESDWELVGWRMADWPSHAHITPQVQGSAAAWLELAVRGTEWTQYLFQESRASNLRTVLMVRRFSELLIMISLY